MDEDEDETSRINDIRNSATPETKNLKCKVTHVEDIRSNGRRKLLIIGKTGTGKSTLCNVLTGNPFNADIFPVSSGAASCTQKTKFCDAFFNGNNEDPVSIIDTIGFDDPSTDNDAEIVAELVDKLKNACDFVNCVVLAVNGQNPRLDGSLVGMIRIFEGMFGSKFWDQMVVVFTRMPMDKKNKKKRLRSTENKTDDDVANSYMNEVKKKFESSVPERLQHLFIDACYDEDDEDENKSFKEATYLLRTLLFEPDGLPTNQIKLVETEHQKLNEKVKKAEDERKEYEKAAEDARKEKEALETKHQLEIVKLEKQRIEKENELRIKQEKLREEKIQAQEKMSEAEKKESEAKYKADIAELKRQNSEEKSKEKHEMNEKHQRDMDELKRKNEELDQKAKSRGFSYWDWCPLAGTIRRLVKD